MKNKIFILLCALSLNFFAQTVTGVDTLLKSGPVNARINLVIISEGFTAAQMNQFITNATSLSTTLFNQAPFKNYKKYFNVFAIKCPSPQSGISHPGTATDVVEPQIPVSSVNNNFNTSFDSYFTHRSIYSANAGAVYAVLAAGFPAYDIVVVLGNSLEYGGTGGPYAVMSINGSAPETLLHEVGHSFAGLADEYWAGTVFAQEKPNMTANSNTATVKWSQWVGLNGVSEYAYDTFSPASTWFRPHQNCKMRFLGAPFCSVCMETIIEKIHSLTNPIDAYAPANTGVVPYTAPAQWFKTKLVKPVPNTLKNVWEINSVPVAGHADSLLVQNAVLFQGSNTIMFTTTDTTVMSKDLNHANLHSYSVVWNIEYTVNVGIKEITRGIEFSIFPNPATDLVNLNYSLTAESEVGVSVTDMSGRVLISEKSRKMAAGEYKSEIDVSSLPQGNYILALKINEKTINNKFIIFK